MEQTECRVSNPFPAADCSQHDRRLTEYDKQNVRQVKADSRVSSDSKQDLHLSMMRRVQRLFPSALVAW